MQNFASGDESLDDPPLSGRPLSLNDDDLRTTIKMYSKWICRELAAKFYVIEETIRSHLILLSKWVSHSLKPENKLKRLTIHSYYLSRLKSERLFFQILTCDEKWVTYSNNKRSHNGLSSSDPLPQKPKVTVTTKKTLPCVWWIFTGIIHHVYLDVGTM